MRGGEYQDFTSKIYCLTEPKNLAGQPFSVSLTLGYQKMIGIKEGGGYHDFPSKLLCLTVPKKFVEELFLLSEKFWYSFHA